MSKIFVWIPVLINKLIHIKRCFKSVILAAVEPCFLRRSWEWNYKDSVASQQYLLNSCQQHVEKQQPVSLLIQQLFLYGYSTLKKRKNTLFNVICLSHFTQVNKFVLTLYCIGIENYKQEEIIFNYQFTKMFQKVKTWTVSFSLTPCDS